MNNYIKVILSNTLKHEARHILDEGIYTDGIESKDKDEKIDKLNTIYNLQKIINNYDELEPILREYFDKKAELDKWGR